MPVNICSIDCKNKNPDVLLGIIRACEPDLSVCRLGFYPVATRDFIPRMMMLCFETLTPIRPFFTQDLMHALISRCVAPAMAWREKMAACRIAVSGAAMAGAK